MAFLNKEQVERYAKEHGIDLTGMTWQQKQKAISEHMKENGITSEQATGKPSRKTTEQEEIARLKQELEKAKAEAKAVPQVPVIFDLGTNEPEPTIDDYENVVLIASPEQRPTTYQRNKWYEKIGKEIETQEISYGVGKDSPFNGDESGTRSATYKTIKTNRDLTATSTMPKYSCLITYRPTKDLCAIAEYGGHRGYLWTHQRLPNVKGLLTMMDAYEEFKDRWLEGRGHLFYLGGLLCCDISFTDSMMKRIQIELRKRDRDGDIL